MVFCRPLFVCVYLCAFGFWMFDSCFQIYLTGKLFDVMGVLFGWILFDRNETGLSQLGECACVCGYCVADCSGLSVWLVGWSIGRLIDWLVDWIGLMICGGWR